MHLSVCVQGVRVQAERRLPGSSQQLVRSATSSAAKDLRLQVIGCQCRCWLAGMCM